MEEPDWIKNVKTSIIYSYDNATANPGEFTKKLISLMKEVMRKNSGSNESRLVSRKVVETIIDSEHDIARNNTDGRY